MILSPPPACFFCGSENLTTGYGLAAGPIGAYTYCDDCEQLVAYAPELDGLRPEDAEQIKENDARLQRYLDNSKLSWRRRNEVIRVRMILFDYVSHHLQTKATLTPHEQELVKQITTELREVWGGKDDCV